MRKLIVRVVQYLTIMLLLVLVGVAAYGCVLRVHVIKVEAIKAGAHK